jgi:Raf kinase inhibitor-like YbhB/YbcL family protein
VFSSTFGDVMNYLKSILIVYSLFLIYSCAEKDPLIMNLNSDVFTNGALIPVEFTCEGEDVSPYLEWSDAPQNVKSFALTCVDPDAPMGDWIHWIAWNIPAGWSALEKGINPEDQSFFTQGTNSWGLTGYGGPCPPVGHGPHRYYFSFHALDTVLELESSATIKELQKAINGHVLATGVIMGKYER